MSKQSQSKKILQVATVAMTPDLDPKVSRDRIRQIVEDTKCDHPDVRLILFGETILGWFYKEGETKEYHESIAETVPGITTEFIGELAKAHDVYISFGLSEKSEAKLYNAQVLISPTGEVVAKHRKFWIKNKVFSPGNQKLTTADIDGVKVAILICADARSLKLLRAIRRERVDLVLASLADYATGKRINQLMGAFYDTALRLWNEQGTGSRPQADDDESQQAGPPHATIARWLQVCRTGYCADAPDGLEGRQEAT